MAFDFFNISGSMFIEHNTDSSVRSSAQGLFMMMTNGFGAYFGTIASSWVIDTYFITQSGDTNWEGIWISFALYSLCVALLFWIFFKHKHGDEKIHSPQSH
jgi:NHS family xanthosine MFS transporter